jgi:hypothetical protein
MPVTLVKSGWVDGNLEFYDSAGDRICYLDSANRSFVVDAAAAIMHGSTSISGAEIGLLDTATAGSITASKVVSRDAGKRIPFETAVPAGAGNTTANATVLTADVNLVTGADGTVGVRLPASVLGMRIEVVNTVTSALLKVYPSTGGQINAAGADVAFELAASRTGTFVCTAADVWHVEKQASSSIQARSTLATDTSQKYGLEVRSDALAALGAAEAGGTFNRSVAANVQLIQGEITDNETEVSIGYAQFQLPPEYVAAASCVLRIPSNIVKTGAAVDNGSTLDAEVFKSAGNGTVGADICATAAVTFAAVDTWYDKDFTITAASLSPGDVINIKFTASIIDSEAGAGTLRLNMETPYLLLSVQG